MTFKLFEIFQKYSPGKTLYVLLLSLISGITGGAVVPLIISSVGSISENHYIFYAVSLPLTGMVFILAKRTSQQQTAILTETVLEKLVIGITDTVRHSELPEIEAKNRSALYLTIVNAKAVAHGTTKAIDTFENIINLFVCWLCIFWISPVAGLVVLFTLLGLTVAYELYQMVKRSFIHKEERQESAMFDAFNHILDGFKELKINQLKSGDLFDNYLTPLVMKLKNTRFQVLFYYSEYNVFVHVSFILSMGVNVFFFSPYYSQDTIISILVIMVYMNRPIFIILAALPDIADGVSALKQLYELADDEAIFQGGNIYDPSREIINTFENITLENIGFTYSTSDKEPGFSIGPIDLTIKNKEILFLVGGNGSGKSTLMKIITGLYRPRTGTITIDGMPVDMSDHRYLFSAIFTDFHLFDALYGSESVDEEQVNKFLTDMELLNKTRYTEGRFSTLSLSTGQRKRLALIVAMLDDKPVLVFDEWAADQAPHFREYFYEKLLPSLKLIGKTLIVVTHDDRYFQKADRVLKMEYGSITESLQQRQEYSGQDEGQIARIGGPRLRKKQKDMVLNSDTDKSFREIYDKHEKQPEKEGTEKQTTMFQKFLKDISSTSSVIGSLARMAALLGICDVLLPLLLYAGTDPAEQSFPRIFILFSITIFAYFLIYRRFNFHLIRFIETSIARIRLDIMERVRKLDVCSFEKLGYERVYTALTHDLKAVSGLTHLMASLFKVIVRGAAISICLAFVSLPVFLFSAMLTGVVGILYGFNQILVKKAIYRIREHENMFFETINHLLRGFKELRLNDKKSDDFFHKGIRHHGSRLRTLKIRMSRYFTNSDLYAYGLWNFLMIGGVMIYPFTEAISEVMISKFVCLVLLMPVVVLVNYVPRVVLAGISIQRLYELRENLELLSQEPLHENEEPEKIEFEKVEYIEVSFQYEDSGGSSFSVGPMTLSFQRGEIVFITGGNGSGKSTLMKLLTGLYHAETGKIFLNGHQAEIWQHRYLFSIIFTDFHLFDRLYGMSDADEAKVNELLRLMLLDRKVRFTEGKFSTLELSTGQKKRLAMVAAIMENKPIYVFDEWAADQDPGFRQYFYESLLPSLKAQGKTIIAVTHDDRYFHVADRVLKVEYGQLTDL